MRSRLPIAFAIALCALLAQGLVAGDVAHAQRRGQQILFATDGVKVASLRIEGTNQRGQDVVWQMPVPPAGGTSFAHTKDWWWDGSVVMSFDVVGEGRRQCVFDYIGGEATNVALITYPHAIRTSSGNSVVGCSGDQGSARAVGMTYVQAWLNALEPPSKEPAYAFYERLVLVDDAYSCIEALALRVGHAPLACAGVGNEVLEWVIQRADGGEIPPPSEADVSSLTTLVIDSSGSMADLDPRGGTKMEAAIRAADQLLGMVETENRHQGTRHRAGAVDFHSTASVIAAATEDIPAVRSAVAGLAAGGGTEMAGGLQHAIDSSDGETAQRILVLLSDGVANDASAVRAVIPRLASAYDCVYTIGLGAPEEASAAADPLSTLFGGMLGGWFGGAVYDEQLLRDIAAATPCGGFYTASNAFELSHVYVRLRHQSVGEVVGEVTGTIAQGATSDPIDLSVPRGAGELHVTLNWPGSALDLLLRDPSGRLVDATYPGAAVTTGPPPIYAIIAQPKPGRWSAAVFGRDVPEDVEPYGVVASTRGIVQPRGPSGSTLLFVSGIGLVAIGLVALSRVSSDRTHRPRPAKVGRPTVDLILQEPGHPARAVRVTGRVRIGRAPDADVVIADPKVSRRHCELVPVAPGVWGVIDTDSATGTHCNDQRVRRARVQAGDVVRIGETRIRLVDPHAAPSARAATAPR